jgi:hypothetical protein
MTPRSPSKYEPSKELVSDALNDIVYEMEQLIGNYLLRMRLNDRNWAPRDPLESAIQPNVYLEGFLLHFRVLLDFFERPNRSSRRDQELDDVLCSDFSFSPAKVDLDGQIRNRINQEVAHLSYSRTLRTDESRHWLTGPMIAPILRRCDSFAVHVLGSPVISVPGAVRQRLKDVRSAVALVLANSEV